MLRPRHEFPTLLFRLTALLLLAGIGALASYYVLA